MTEATSDSQPTATADEAHLPPVPPTALKPGVAEMFADVWHDLIGYLSLMEESSERAQTALITYMERLILLAGGTLTLTFTALASISSHPHGSQQRAAHIGLVIASCWLLIATISLSLVCIKFLIALRQKLANQNVLMTIDTQLKLKLLSIDSIRTADQLEKINNFPRIYDPDRLTSSITYLKKWVAGMTWAAQLTLFAAFILLASFIQANITRMLSS